MAPLIIIVIVIIALLLGLVVLVQNPKGGGLATGFQGSSQIGGVQRTADFLEKATWYLVGALFVLCLVSSIWFTTPTVIGGGEEGASGAPTEQTDGGSTDNGENQGDQGGQPAQ
jgi:preprotein translocase subunit SecG